MDISIQQEIMMRFRNGAVCPHCSSRLINKFGFFNGKQRYRCKECGKTFNLYTNTLLSWSHYKDKWEGFIKTMKNDMSLRQAGTEIGVSYASLFYWRHKIMTILNEENDDKYHGFLELINMKLKYTDKYRNRGEEDFNEGKSRNIIFAFIYQRDNRLDSYIYKERNGHRPFIDELYYNIGENALLCLSSNYPYRYPLLYKKVRIADKKKYKRSNYFNTDTVRKYSCDFRYWSKMFRGVSSKNLIKYAAFFKTHKIFNNMECRILSSLREYENLRNQQAAEGVFSF